jgi:hypothetical protein
MLIGVAGGAEHGKDSIAKALVASQGFKHKALATKMKEAALALDPIIDYMPVGPEPKNPSHSQSVVPIRLSAMIEHYGAEEAKKHPEVRRTYQRMGTEVGRETIDPDLWVKLCIGPLRRDLNYVISDVRFINELTAIQKRDGLVWRVIRPGWESTLGANAGHRSEMELTDESGLYDAIIINDGTLEDLAKKVARAYEECDQGWQDRSSTPTY